MPRGDGTGPMGMGSMTGRGAGYCAGYGVAGYANAPRTRGFGRGNSCRGFGGGGRGWRHQFYATGLPGWMRAGVSPQVLNQQQEADREREFLKQQAESIQKELEVIKKRLEELSKESSS